MASVLLVGLIGLYVVVMALAPMPAVVATPNRIEVSVPVRPAIAWPTQGQAAVGISGSGVVATNGAQTSVPIASIAKLVLALAVVEKQPIEPGQPGTTITFTDADEQLYRDKVAQNQSVVPIATDEQFTEYQALQAMLIPSGNNIADSVAIRVFGSVSGYVAYANDLLITWGLTETHVDDASGFSPKTVSSASNLVRLGERVLAHPVLAQIVNQPSVTLPVAGEVHNVNALLGQDGIVGIKTGTTDEAGGCLLFAVDPGNNQPLIIGAFLGQADRPAVLAATTSFIRASAGNFAPVNVAPEHQPVATYAVPWAKPVNVLTKTVATIASPTGQAITTSVNASDLKDSTAAGSPVGTLKATTGDTATETELVLATAIDRPSIGWKLLHPRADFQAIGQRLK